MALAPPGSVVAVSDDQQFPPQTQPRPGHEGAMRPEPRDDMRGRRSSGQLEGRTGGARPDRR